MAQQRKLGDEVKAFIVNALACFDTPTAVVSAVKAEFGLVITRQQVQTYDPKSKAGARLSEKWRAVFEATREAFLEDTAEIAISHRAVRLRALQRMADKTEATGNFALSSQLLEQAAKEMGNAFTNRRELTGKDGADLPTAPATPVVVYQLPDNGRSG